MPSPAHLFVTAPLSGALDALALQAREQLKKWNPDDLLSQPDSDIVAALLETAKVACPVLGDAELEPAPSEVQRTDPPAVGTFGEPVTRTLTVYKLHVPFTGDAPVFQLKPSHGYFGLALEATIKVGEGELILEWVGENPNREQVRTHFDVQLEKIRQLLEWAGADIDVHNARMEIEIPKTVAERRAKLLADRDVHASIGFPIRRRDDADTHRVPVVRRQVRPDRPPTSATRHAFAPEPALDEADYEAALAVLRNARNALERSPSTTSKLNEQEIRDQLLVLLNAQFEGQTGGELFNGAGKTDILIRVDDANVFIGECKIYGPKDGPKKITDTINQLLGYMTWRDTKGAVILLIRGRDVTSAINKAVETFTSHPNFKRRGKIANDERHDFVLHANGDPARELHVAFLPFIIGAAAAP